MQALDLAARWERLLAVVAWLQAHPRPGVYLRQFDVPGLDSKFIEAHRGVLAELLDLAGCHQKSSSLTRPASRSSHADSASWTSPSGFGFVFGAGYG